MGVDDRLLLRAPRAREESSTMTTSVRVGLPLVAVFSTLLLQSGTAHADPPGDKALADVDAAMNRAQTQYFEYDVTNQEPGKAEKRIGFNVRLKGERRLTEFTAPADMKGTKLLIVSPTMMYAYLPAFGKVRRIASHTSDQGFMGMAFSQDDFATTRYGDAYTATVLSDGAKEIKLAATPKAGKETPYAKIEFTIAKDRMLPTELRYFDASGKNVKTETRTNYTCQGNVCTPAEQKMVDNTKGGLWTKMTRKTWKVNEAMSDDLFSLRNLEK